MIAVRHFVILTALFQGVTTSANAAVFKFDERGNGGGIVETLETIDDPAAQAWRRDQFPSEPVEDCIVKEVHTRCVDLNGDIRAIRAFPVMPTQLMSAIQAGHLHGVSGFTYDRVQFWQGIRNFDFRNRFELLNPLNSGWASPEKILWIDITTDPDAAEVFRVWSSIVESSGRRPFGKDGFFVASVSHSGGAVRTVQACWMFFNPDDPFPPKCTAVVLQRSGRTYVRFIKGYYNGGYAFEPDNVFICPAELGPNNVANYQKLSKLMEEIFSAAPYHLMKHSSDFEDNSGWVRMWAKAQRSSTFPNYREFVDLKVGLQFSTEPKQKNKSYTLALNYSFFITPQNVINLDEMNQPNDVQTKYFNSKLVNFVTQKLACRPRPKFFSR